MKELDYTFNDLDFLRSPRPPDLNTVVMSILRAMKKVDRSGVDHRTVFLKRSFNAPEIHVPVQRPQSTQVLTPIDIRRAKEDIERLARDAYFLNGAFYWQTPMGSVDNIVQTQGDSEWLVTRGDTSIKLSLRRVPTANYDGLAAVSVSLANNKKLIVGRGVNYSLEQSVKVKEIPGGGDLHEDDGDISPMNYTVKLQYDGDKSRMSPSDIVIYHTFSDLRQFCLKHGKKK